jgi:hypothetical protein
MLQKSCGKLHCQKSFKLKYISYKIWLLKQNVAAAALGKMQNDAVIFLADLPNIFVNPEP